MSDVTGETVWLWINFIDPFKSFHGIAVIRDDDFARINAVGGGRWHEHMRVPADWGDPPEAYRNRLLTYEEACELSIAWTGTELADGNGELAN